MTTDVEKCRRINQTVKNTNGSLTVTFNYRYNPVHEAVKRLIASGEIGKGSYGCLPFRSAYAYSCFLYSPSLWYFLVLSVHFEWLLDTVHGADYFRRWHRQKFNSGGLMVHKSGHHFDLVNWWIDAEPVEVAGFGKLAFYGKQNGEQNGYAKNYERASGSKEAREDPFAIHLEDDPTLKSLYVEAEKEDGYHRDQNVGSAYSVFFEARSHIETQVFAQDIGIEDDMALIVRYNNDATMTYHLVCFSSTCLIHGIESCSSDCVFALGRLSRHVQRLERPPRA